MKLNREFAQPYRSYLNFSSRSMWWGKQKVNPSWFSLTDWRKTIEWESQRKAENKDTAPIFQVFFLHSEGEKLAPHFISCRLSLEEQRPYNFCW